MLNFRARSVCSSMIQNFSQRQTFMRGRFFVEKKLARIVCIEV